MIFDPITRHLTNARDTCLERWTPTIDTEPADGWTPFGALVHVTNGELLEALEPARYLNMACNDLYGSVYADWWSTEPERTRRDIERLFELAIALASGGNAGALLEPEPERPLMPAAA